MACKSAYELHHHFPKLAEESGFTFNTHRPRIRIDWDKIRLIDIENLIRERRFVLIEQYLNDILNCVLESEFDVRILDEGVLKMFRLAQLAVEYQQFCRHYLDRSVYVLREELTALAQELDVTKKDLREKEEEIRKVRKKTKHTYRTPLPYGNDNIATMILKTLTNKSDIFPSTSNGDAAHYNKCNYCDKVFLNQLYLKSHISRRHTNVTEIPQKDVTENVQFNTHENNNSKLNDEISELKSKLMEMENFIAKVRKEGNITTALQDITHENTVNSTTQMKDAEVSTNSEDYILDKFEAWKKEEFDKYNKEINLLRTQIIETINSFKDKEVQKPPVQNESNLIEQLHTTIKQQGSEILTLKQELINSKHKSEDEENERRKEVDTQMSFWAKRVETQSKQYEALLQKLNDMAKEAHESRAAAEAERERSEQLQVQLQQNINNKRAENKDNSTKHITTPIRNTNSTANAKTAFKKRSYQRTKPISDPKTLENLHRQAQELLALGSTSSSDVSSASIENAKNIGRKKILRNSEDTKSENILISDKENKLPQRKKSNHKITEKIGNHVSKMVKTNEQKVKKGKLKSQLKDNMKLESPILVPGSPMKLVRAKLTEEVNNCLVSVGVDPLKSRLPQNVFRKQRMMLQQQQESKSKKNPAYQKIKHSILAYLDSSTSDMRKEVTGTDDYISPSKITKAFSLTSVISNVKSKALSLVKSTDVNIKTKRNALNAEVAKKAMSLLKTPPGSAPASPSVTQSNLNELKPKIDSSTREVKTNSSDNKLWYNPEAITVHKQKQPRKILKQATITADDSDEKSNDSDHKYYNSAIIQQSANSIEHLIKSPARRPASASANYTGPIRKFTIDNGENLSRAQSATNINGFRSDVNNKHINNPASENDDSSSDNVESSDAQIKKSKSEENIQVNPKQTKGVLKNASSTSSLNKKKVLFDMEAIQMKSVSASPSQSITDKSDTNEKFELGLINLDGEEWDISSIENEPLKNDTRIQVNTRTSPKIAELKHTIESQLARRNETPSTVLVGGVDVLAGRMSRAASIAGSNTSLGSSILDESDTIPVVNNKAFVKPKKVTEKDDSELDISEYSIDGIINRKENESF